MTEADITRISSAARQCCGSLGCPPSDLDDAVQEVLIQYLKLRAKGKPPSIAFACQNALRRLNDTRNLRRQAFREGLTSLPTDLADAGSDDPAEIAERNEERERFLATLTERERKVLSLRREGWTVEEIPTKLGYSHQATSRILRDLDEKWAKKVD